MCPWKLLTSSFQALSQTFRAQFQLQKSNIGLCMITFPIFYSQEYTKQPGSAVAVLKQTLFNFKIIHFILFHWRYDYMITIYFNKSLVFIWYWIIPVRASITDTLSLERKQRKSGWLLAGEWWLPSIMRDYYLPTPWGQY